MMNSLRSLSLLSTPVTFISWTALAIAVIVTVLLLPRGKRIRMLTIAWGLTLGVTAITMIVLLFVLRIPAEEIPTMIVAATALFLGALTTMVAGLFQRKRSLFGLIPLTAALVATLVLINQAYVLYPDVRALEADTQLATEHFDDLPTAKHAIPLAKWSAPRHGGLPTEGVLVSDNPDNSPSKFNNRAATVYLPPAWFSDPRPQLPVLVLNPGSPGDTESWFTLGMANDLANRYQREHNGVAPIIASVDSTGSLLGNPLCTDSPQGNVSTFLTRDVPEWLKTRYNADPDQSTWTIGGLSYGGTCSLQTILNYPQSYGAFLDFSGERTPNDGKSHETTVKTFFNDSEELFKKKNPEDILRGNVPAAGDLSQLRGRFLSGKNDKQAMQDLQLLNSLAQDAGADSHFDSVPGSHNWTAWRAALSNTFPFVTSIAGLPEGKPEHHE